MRESERLIDLPKLANVLYRLEVANAARTTESGDFIKECVESLKSNIAHKKLQGFLKQAGKIFCKWGDTQFQILIANFIKDSLDSDEIQTLRILITNSTRRVLTPKRRELMLFELS